MTESTGLPTMTYSYLLAHFPEQLPTLITLFAAAATCARLLCYRRCGAQFHRHISVCAWLLIIGTGTLTLQILGGRFLLFPVSWGTTCIVSVLCGLVFRARGNVAKIVRVAQ